MKQILFLSLIILSSCVHLRQKSNLTGRIDEVYFTPNDTRIVLNDNKEESAYDKSQTKLIVKNYSLSYSERLSSFGNTGRFNYNNYQPQLAHSYALQGFSISTLGSEYYNPIASPCGCGMSKTNVGWGEPWMMGYYSINNIYPYSSIFYIGSGKYSKKGIIRSIASQYNSSIKSIGNTQPIRLENNGVNSGRPASGSNPQDGNIIRK